MQGVIETADFLADAVDVGMAEHERALIVLAVSENPKLGDLMPGTGGARKVRFPVTGKGKRGGYRVIYYYGGDDIPVFLLATLKKSERADLRQSEKNELRKELAGLKRDYLSMMRTLATAPRSRR